MKSLPKQKTSSWQQSLADAITSVPELLRLLGIDIKAFSAIPSSVLQNFPLMVPREFVMRMHKDDPNDPLLLQVLPHALEGVHEEGYTVDPLLEHQYSQICGILHKYHGRALLLVTNKCAANCRFCFRKHQRHVLQDWGKAIQYLSADNSISEVILSGGDPLMLADSELAVLIEKLAAIPHLKYLRLHTRLPILIPSRITEELLQILALVMARFKVVVMIHCNHAQEIDADVVSALSKLRGIGLQIFSQTVLLHKVNDTPTALIELNEALFAIGVVPYYLHLLDKVAGGKRFNVDLEQAKKLLAELMSKLPGYLVPRLVRDDGISAYKRIIVP